jgi:hypothetical protein
MQTLVARAESGSDESLAGPPPCDSRVSAQSWDLLLTSPSRGYRNLERNVLKAFW